jgi:hypothetical protein
MSTPNPIRPAQLDPDTGTITIAVTFRWNPIWALDGCEAAGLIGDLRRLLAEHYGTPNWAHKLAGLESVLSWDPDWERLCGSTAEPVTFDARNPLQTPGSPEWTRAMTEIFTQQEG